MAALTVAIEGKRYPGASETLLAGLRFALGGGEVAAITGRSGCGKTTLLNIIAGLDQDYQGEVALDSARVSLMFQEPLLLPWLTVRDNIALGLRDNAAKIAAEWIEKVGLGGWENAHPNQLSMGMSRRAALARALAPAPHLLLLDEPFVSLDEPAAVQLRALFLRLLAKTEAAAIFVTHNLREALTVADRLLIIGGGKNAMLADVAIPAAQGEKEIDKLTADFAAKYANLIASPENKSA